MSQPSSVSRKDIKLTKQASITPCTKSIEKTESRNFQCKKISGKKPTKKQQAKRSRRVEVLDAKSLENLPLPPVRIESETCEISLNSRIQKITGIPKSQLHNKLPDLPISKSITTLSRNELNHPKLQSSLTLLQTVEQLKKLEINASYLTNLKLQNESTGKNLERKMYGVLNIDQSERVFSHLQPLVMNSDQLADVEELKRHNLAERCAPKKIVKDPGLLLKDFVQIPCTFKEPCIPKHTTFLEKCHDFQMDPFSLHSIPESNKFESYRFWLD